MVIFQTSKDAWFNRLSVNTLLYIVSFGKDTRRYDGEISFKMRYMEFSIKLKVPLSRVQSPQI